MFPLWDGCPGASMSFCTLSESCPLSTVPLLRSTPTGLWKLEVEQAHPFSQCPSDVSTATSGERIRTVFAK